MWIKAEDRRGYSLDEKSCLWYEYPWMTLLLRIMDSLDIPSC